MQLKFETSFIFIKLVLHFYVRLTFPFCMFWWRSDSDLDRVYWCDPVRYSPSQARLQQSTSICGHRVQIAVSYARRRVEEKIKWKMGVHFSLLLPSCGASLLDQLIDCSIFNAISQAICCKGADHWMLQKDTSPNF